jgi:hypothetical protein
MDVRSRRQYLETLLNRYLKAKKKEKGRLLDEYCRNTGQNRKYVIRKIATLAFGTPRPRKKRMVEYGKDVQVGLGTLWEIFDRPCGQRLKPMIIAELGRLRWLKEMEITDKTAGKLVRISPATIDRLLRPQKAVWKAGRRYASRGPNLIAKRIPLRLTDWDGAGVGQIEMDLVFHCGATTAGDFVSSLSAMDIASEWWEGEGILGRSQQRVFKGLEDIRARCPFRWMGIDSDNDSMFINDLLYRYCEREGLTFSRSRPYHKNDNAHIEQKNFTHVRRPLGYLRYDTQAELDLINDLYRNELRLYKNFFQPVMKLVRKGRNEGRLVRAHDVPKTPYQRLMDSDQVPPETKKRLREVYESLNPADLKRRIDKKLARVYALYEKKKKRPVTVDPYKRLEPTTVTFLMT